MGGHHNHELFRMLLSDLPKDFDPMFRANPHIQ